MNKPIAVPTATTTLAELVGMGATITFRSGRSLRGLTKTRYIEVANEFGGLGLWDMDASDGIDSAVRDLQKDAAEHGQDLHGIEIVASEDDADDSEEDDADEG